MDDLLYLDTARVGRPSRRTLRAAADAVALAAEEGGSAYFDRFLRGGLTDGPAWMPARFPGLADWRGVAALKADIRALAGGPPDLPVLLANRSASLMALAARLLFPRCRHVLACDLGWPAYHEILMREAAWLAGRVTVMPVRDMAFGGRATADELEEAMARVYSEGRCDGLFLPAVSHLGVRVPVERLVRRVEAAGGVRLVVVDGAQELGHTAAALLNDYCDFYLAGCHKWLGGHHPLGIGIYGRRRSREFVTTAVARYVEAGVVDDPLLRFVQQIEDGSADGYSETVNLSGLFTAQSAVSDALAADPDNLLTCQRLACRTAVADELAAAGWRDEPLDASLRTGILLARSGRATRTRVEPNQLRATLRERGVSATVYDGGVVRLSVPSSGLQQPQLQQVGAAFRSVL